jgi:nucleotide-binding universal stress UspA family protein
MRRFKNILAVYSDVVGDDNALTQATALAERNDARLTVIEVVKDAAASPAHLTERQKHLSRIAATIGQEGIKVTTTVSIGTPFLQIIRQVLRESHDLVIMAAEGGGGFKSLFLGSTSMHLMRKCPCPIWIVNPGKSTDYARILAAVDPSPDDVDVDELNIKILDLATSLARLNKSELHIFHAWELTGNDLDTIRSEMTGEERDLLLRKNELMHRKPIERLLEPYALDNLQHHVHVVRGDPGFLLPQMAEEKEIDLIVMGTVHRTGIAGFFIGNTAEFILRQVECAVLTVKPEGFVTPITLED